jgi:hypothetical protein
LWSLVNGAWLYYDYTYSAVPPVPAQMLTPAIGSTNINDSMSLTWNAGVGASQYALWVGSASNTYDIQAIVVGTNLFRTVTVPTDGRTLWVRLWTQGYSSWVFNDYRYMAYSALRFTGMGSNLPSGTLNSSYNQLLQAAGGTAPYTWSWSGSTPPGMTLAADGTLSGTPTTPGVYNFTLGLRDNVGATTNQSISLTVQGADVSNAAALKMRHYVQTNTSAAALTATPYGFLSFVGQTAVAAVTNVTLRLPDTSTRSLSAPTKTALDAAYTNGNYTFTIEAAHDGTNAFTLGLPTDNYPAAAPHVSNWIAAQSVNPAANFTLMWDALTSGTTNDLVWVTIKNWVGGAPGSNVFQSGWFGPGALNGTNRSVVIPAGTFVTNQTYHAQIAWCRLGSLNTTGYPPATGVGGYVTDTELFINTTSPAQMTSPTNGTVFAGNSATFNWNQGASVSQYALWVGSASNGYDLCATATGTNRSLTVTLPASGSNLYVRLWSFINSAWQYNDYVYTAAIPAKAVMLSPADGSTNNSASVTYTWSAGAGVSQYALWVGSATNSSDLYALALGTNLSRTLTLPVDGRTLYTRLWSCTNSVWDYNDYTYRAQPTAKARFTGLANGATFGATNITLTWDAGVGATQYALWVGNSAGTYDLYALALGTNRSQLLNLPADGRALYVTLWSLINGEWKRNDYKFTAFTTASAAQMITPTNGTTFASSPVTFTWSSGTGVSQYAMWMGSAWGDYDLYAAALGTNLTQQVPVPLDGNGVYVRLWSLIGGVWDRVDYEYGTAYSSGKTKAVMTTPGANGSVLGGASAGFAWSAGVGATQYALWAGTTPGSYNLYAAAEGTNLTRTVTIPPDGGPVYVRLWSQIDGAWKFNEYFYSAYLAP